MRFPVRVRCALLAAGVVALGAVTPASGATTLGRQIASAGGGWSWGVDYAVGFTIGELGVSYGSDVLTTYDLWAGFWSPELVIALDVEGPAHGIPGPALRIWPNPSAGVVALHWSTAPGARGHAPRASIFDPRGRRVRDLAAAPGDSEGFRFEWDGRDMRGAQVDAGLYFCRIEDGSRVEVRRLARIQ